MATFNTREVLSINQAAKMLAVERRNSINEQDTIYLNISNMNKTAYGFQLIASNFDPLLTAFIEDKFTGNAHQLKMSDTTYVPFTVNDDAGSFASDRFRIIFKTAKTLATAITSIKAYAKDTRIMVDWTVTDQRNTRAFVVEKSADGRNFTEATTAAPHANATGTQQYSWIDNAPAQGDNFYRIKTLQTSGQTLYTAVAKVNLAHLSTGVTVYPNPVGDGVVNILFRNETAGLYQLRLVNTSGQVVTDASFRYEGGTAQAKLNVTSVASGTYQLQVTGAQKTVHTIHVLIAK